jgi:hypothetical protein
VDGDRHKSFKDSMITYDVRRRVCKDKIEGEKDRLIRHKFKVRRKQ